MCDVKKAVDELLAGNVIAIPTETVYGLAVDIGNKDAVNKLFSLKHRSINKPFAIAVAHPEQIKPWVTEISYEAQRLITTFWPGSLTLILPASEHVPHAVHAGYGSVGLRCSPSEKVQEVIALLGRPICLTSANRAGEREATTARCVYEYFQEEILIVEGDDLVSGVVSTIVDLSSSPFTCLREGAIPFKAIQQVLL